MSDSFSKKLSQMMGKMDEKVMKKKLNAALEMLQNGDTQELAKKLNKVDKNDLMKKIDEFDKSKLDDMNIDLNEIKSKVSDADLQKLSQLVGEQGDEIVKKLKDIIK